MTRTRALQDPSGKTWSTRCEAADVIVRAGTPGKEKESTKTQVDAKAAVAYAQKEEWSRLKKGFVLANPDARAGEPLMHRYLGRGYTGALPITDFNGQLLCSRNLASDEHPQAAGRDQLLVIGADAQQSDAFEAPENTLIWRAVHLPALDRLLVLADHQVLAWSGATRRFDALSPANRTPASFLSGTGTHAAWFSEPELVVRDLAATGGDVTLLRHAAEPELHGGHTPQMEGALSSTGVLAFCERVGEVQFVNIADGTTRPAWQGDFKMVDRLAFTPDGRWLLAREQYGAWTLRCYDMKAAAPRADWPSFGDLSSSDFALDARGERLAIAHRGHVELFEFATMKPLLRFAVDHVVKRCAIAWIGSDAIGVRTDYGCASLYAVTAAA